MMLNVRAARLVNRFLRNAADLRIAYSRATDGPRILDFGVQAEGGLIAGLGLARVCLADLAKVTLLPPTAADLPWPTVHVVTDQPVLACMASQYAGWQIAVGKYFAMGSGPMRATYHKEEVFQHLRYGPELPMEAVGVLETRKLPTPEVIAYLAEKLQLPPERLTLLAAPTASLAGTVQIVARALETALHKLYELKFDLHQILSGVGAAPLPPAAADDLTALGRTNDAILYGGRVTLWVRADDDQLAEVGPRVPSSASPDHGAPFADIFERYHRDFYKIDPLLFSPAAVVFHNLRSGRSHVFGRLEPEVLRQSFVS